MIVELVYTFFQCNFKKIRQANTPPKPPKPKQANKRPKSHLYNYRGNHYKCFHIRINIGIKVYICWVIFLV